MRKKKKVLYKDKCGHLVWVQKKEKVGEMMELQIQSDIYGNKKEALLKAISALKQTVQVYHKKVGELKVSLVYGDASPNRIFSEEDVRRIKKT